MELWNKLKKITKKDKDYNSKSYIKDPVSDKLDDELKQKGETDE